MKILPNNLQSIEESLAKNAKALSLWKELTPIGRRDFASWVTSARKIETQQKRLERIPSMLVSGKKRPCCYSLVPMSLYKALASDSRAKAKWKELTSDEKRDLIDWIESAKDSEMREMRILKVFNALVHGVGNVVDIEKNID